LKSLIIALFWCENGTVTAMGSDYYWYKSHGICVDCHAESADRGKTRCWRCRVKNNESAQNRRAKQTTEQRQARLEYRKSYNYRVYHQRKEASICVVCGKRAADKYVRCEICEKRMNYKRRQRASYIEARQPYFYGKG
jgi:predicted amidophosphoribosyltransferase